MHSVSHRRGKSGRLARRIAVAASAMALGLLASSCVDERSEEASVPRDRKPPKKIPSAYRVPEADASRGARDVASPDTVAPGPLYGERWPGGADTSPGRPPQRGEADDQPGSEERASKAELQEAADLARAGKFSEALEKLDGLRKKYPSDAEVCYQIGILHARSGKLKEAEEHLVAATKLNPKSARAFCDLALVCRELQKTEDALKAAREACHLDVTNPRCYNVLGLVYLALEDASNAEVAFSEAVSRSPHNPMYLHNLGRAYALRRDHAHAKQCLDEVIKLAPAADAYNDRGRTLEAQSDMKGARNDYLAALKADSGNALACYNLARVMSNQGDPERFDPGMAAGYAKRAVALTGQKNALYLAMLAHTQRLNRKMDEAVETQRKAVKIDPTKENQRLLQELLDERGLSPAPYRDK